ncbi:TPA: hypothetical protein ACH3X3_010688 [Trebouxia sp. C0006]
MSWYEVDKAGFDERVQSEAFALNGIDLLPELPLCTAGEVAMFYDDFVQAEVAAITYSKAKYKNQVVNYFLDPAEEDSEQESENIPGHTALHRGDRDLFIQKGDKDVLHRILSNAPFGINSCNELSFGARLVLKSEKKAGVVDHCQCAQFCFDLMCKMSREGSAVLYVCFAKASYEHYIPCIRIAKYISSGGEVTVCNPAFPAAALDLLSAQTKKSQQLHDDKIAMAKTLAESDANIKAKKKAAKQQMTLPEKEPCLLFTAMRAEVAGLEVEKARDEREAAESACVAAAVAEADGNIEKAAQKLADMRRNMQHDCGTVHFPKEGRHVHAHPEP